MFLAFLAAEKLKNTIPAPLGVGRVGRESCFWLFKSSKIQFPLLWSWDGLSGNRVFGAFSCPKPQKYDSRLFCSWDGLSGNRVFGVFSCPKPQKYDSRPWLWDGLSGNRVFGAFSCQNLKNTIPAPLVVGRVERYFWCF